MERGILPAFVVMLSAVLVAMVMLGSSHTQAQTTSAQTTSPQVQLSARRSAQVSGTTTTFMAGSVEIVIPGGAKIIADEANVDRQRGVIDLRGNVRLALPPAMLRQ